MLDNDQWPVAQVASAARDRVAGRMVTLGGAAA